MGDKLKSVLILRNNDERLMQNTSAIDSTEKFSSAMLSVIILITLFMNSSSAFVIFILSIEKNGCLRNALRSCFRFSSNESIC